MSSRFRTLEQEESEEARGLCTDMETQKCLVDLEKGTTCSSWSSNALRLASASIDGSLSIFDPSSSSSSSYNRSSKFTVSSSGVFKVVWAPPEYGDAVACICGDGTLSLWEEVALDTQSVQWELCKSIGSKSSQVLDVQFGVSLSGLKMVCAYSDGYIKVYELLDPLELKNWQLQAEFQNVSDSVSTLGKASCLSASISWKPQSDSQESSFCIGFNSGTSQLNSTKVWEFDNAHQRWLPVAKLDFVDKGDPVYSVAWAPNIGRPYEVIAVASKKGISLWHLGLEPDSAGRISVKQIALLSGHGGEVWQMEWDLSGMSLASTGSDGHVRLWQANLNGGWHEQAAFEATT